MPTKQTTTFELEGDTVYAIGSKGDRYRITLESDDGEKHCECLGFKYGNGKDCSHLKDLRAQAATSADTATQYRLFHGPTQTVVAGGFLSIEDMYPVLTDPSSLPYPLQQLRIEMRVMTTGGESWELCRMASSEVAVMPTPTRPQALCRGCEQITYQDLWEPNDLCPVCWQPYNMECDKD